MKSGLRDYKKNISGVLTDISPRVANGKQIQLGLIWRTLQSEESTWRYTKNRAECSFKGQFIIINHNIEH